MSRPPEVDVTIALTEFVIGRTRDSDGDEPYLWVMRFKVDADTIDTGVLPPHLGVRTFPGTLLTLVAPAEQEIGPGDTPLAIRPQLGAFQTRVRPCRTVGGWFEGLVGIVCLTWEVDNFDYSTQEAGYHAFQKSFGPLLEVELNTLLAGDPEYDDALSRNVHGDVVSAPPDDLKILWRVDRLGDRDARSNVVELVIKRVKSQLRARIESAVLAEADIFELADPDNLTGTGAAVFTSRELLGGFSPIRLRYTEEGADYMINGYTLARRSHHYSIAGTILSAFPCPAVWTQIEAEVCDYGKKTYTVTANEVIVTTRFALTTLAGEQPTRVVWFLDSVPLTGASGSVAVPFAGVADIALGPASPLATRWPGGEGHIAYTIIDKFTIDLTNQDCHGTYSGRLHAFLTYDGDPPIDPDQPGTLQQLDDRSYHTYDDFSILSVEFDYDEAYVRDLENCLHQQITNQTGQTFIGISGPKPRPGQPRPNELTIAQSLIQAHRLLDDIVVVHTAHPDITVLPRLRPR
ncbi:hypothetical protein [Nocardia sp. SC052]|uniref:hypothetical protein n=1 Tax=Nocardia sichangensis TaxID=3385975 RepID=UPI0039A2D97E